MNIEKMKEIASCQIECDCAEVQMHALIHIAETLKAICNVLQDLKK
jgi:hypothetical protein